MNINFKKLARMKLVVVLLLGASIGTLLVGCHSGTMRGAGSDVEKLGQKMEK